MDKYEQIRKDCKKEIESLNISKAQEAQIIMELSMLTDLIVDFCIAQVNNKKSC